MKEIQCATGDRRMNYKRRWTSPGIMLYLQKLEIF